MFESTAHNVNNVCTCAIIVYMNSQCFMAKEKNILRVKELNSQDILESPVRAIRIIEGIFDSFFSFLTYEKDKATSKEKLSDLRRMKKLVKKAIFTDSYDCFRIWEDLDSVFKENQWTFNALEYMEIYLATQKKCIIAHIEGKMLFYVFDHIIFVLAKACKGDRELFSKTIKEYNNLPEIHIEFSKENTPLDTIKEQRLFVQQRFLENFDAEIPLELWLNIYFDATRDETNIFTGSFQTKEFTAFIEEINKMQITCSQKECTQVLT